MQIRGAAGVVADLERYFRITETILKGIVVRAEAHRKSRFKAKPQRSREGTGLAAQEVGHGEFQ